MFRLRGGLLNRITCNISSLS